MAHLHQTHSIGRRFPSTVTQADGVFEAVAASECFAEAIASIVLQAGQSGCLLLD